MILESWWWKMVVLSNTIKRSNWWIEQSYENRPQTLFRFFWDTRYIYIHHTETPLTLALCTNLCTNLTHQWVMKLLYRCLYSTCFVLRPSSSSNNCFWWWSPAFHPLVRFCKQTVMTQNRLNYYITCINCC